VSSSHATRPSSTGASAVTLNGARREIEPGLSVAALVHSLGYVSDQVAVEINGRIVKKRERDTRVVESGDAIEIVTLVGGG
jgi:sulfur carrier protein